MGRTTIFVGLLAALLAAALLGGPRAERAHAGAEVCTPCVVLIEVDGLEAKDVTPQTTPFLWALGHAGDNGSSQLVPPDPNISPVAIGATQVGGIANRNGFTWQAARGVMGATTAAATSALLTGSYADRSDVPADEYVDTGGRELLGSGNTIQPGGDILPDLVAGTDNQAASFLGDPRLQDILGQAGQDKSSVQYAPTSQDMVPAYCPIPQDAEEAKAWSTTPPVCPTADLKVTSTAETALVGTEDGKVNLAYLHLAELGAAKRIYGDVDTTTTPAGQAVAKQLAQTDAAIGTFVESYWHDDPTKWDSTVLMVVGNHGYETTPQTHRVPDPTSPDNPGMGLADVVKGIQPTATFVPQGTIGTVFAGADKSKLSQIAAALMPGTSEVDKQSICQAGSQAPSEPTAAGSTATVAAGCIQEVLATGAVDADGHSTIAGIKSVQDAHPGWHLHAVTKDGKPTGADGDLMVVLKPGWAAGELVPSKDGTTGPSLTGTYQDPANADNPWFGSPGGPRNRSIAAIINGNKSIVRQVSFSQVSGAMPGTPRIDSYPVQKGPLDPENCPTDSYAPVTANANSDPGDDANAPGHECQAETVDFAPTIAALLHLSVPDPAQLEGRFLQEAFKRTLNSVHEEEELPPVAPDDPPPPQEPDVHIPPPPPPAKTYDFDGLMRGLHATVVDANGCTWATAKPGAKMDYLKIEADFGKALSSTTLTFYQQAASTASAKSHRRAAARAVTATNRPAKKGKCLEPKAGKASAHKADASRPPLKAIARFTPFALHRGHVVLNLKIPPLYRPTHAGFFVQEARKLDVPKVGPDGKPGLSFEAFGPATGDIVKIADSERLHQTKPAKARSRKH